jgi:hypothetical protein
MNWKSCAAAVCAAVIASAIAGVPAEAASAKKKQRVTREPAAAQINRNPARVTVPARSFLDPGTELLPGDRKFMDYAVPPGYSAIGVLENTSRYHRGALPGPFDLPGRNNPWPWNWCLGC